MKLKGIVVSICLFTSACGTNLLFHNGQTRDLLLGTQATNTRENLYDVLGRTNGKSSCFYLFGIFPVTDPLNIENALSDAVQKIEGGQTMIDLVIWHETEYFFPIGTVSVVNVEGDVIRFKRESQ
ncbi:hypothetical protein [Leptospira ilyithenensis]|uniref:Lipoprotein n=1 Tax=Leptospira ilyithenensis TaxID=2484901 RepID=A0A4R9LPP8_9LEPT|nr:hypothetical protein [Leptospira ilyithenensis]TGN10057.1 hypothetical protein EHS11_10880 [Leptospira ilyithenensis]